MFILGRNAKDNELNGGGCGECYFICCKNWGLMLVLFIVISLLYIFASFAIAYSQADGDLFK